MKVLKDDNGFFRQGLVELVNLMVLKKYKTKIYETIIIMATILLVKLTSIVFSEILRMVFLSFLFILKSNPYRLIRKVFIVCNYGSKP